MLVIRKDPMRRELSRKPIRNAAAEESEAGLQWSSYEAELRINIVRGDSAPAGSKPMEDSKSIVIRYLEDAIAAEKSFETQLQSFAKEGDDAQAHVLFERHAGETKRQYELLTERLNALGGSPSTVKSFLAHVFGLTPKAASLGHDEAERVTQNLMMAYAVENSEVAMYESLATVARLAGDTVTEQLARRIQQQERETAEKVFALLPASAERSYKRLVSQQSAGARG
jgi:ferritin-like metal-binding protein YciE